MAKKEEVVLKIPAYPEYLELVREFILHVPLMNSISGRERYKIVMALEEACENIISHAYSKNDSDKDIKIIIEFDSKKLSITVIDKGRGFSRDKGIEKKIGEKTTELKIGGLGLYIIENLMDSIDYSINPGVENKVRMIKYL